MATAIGTERARGAARRGFGASEALTGYVLISPAVFLLLVLFAYPFVLAVWISLTDRLLGQPGRFVGLLNFLTLLRNPPFRQTVANSFVYTLVTVLLKMVSASCSRCCSIKTCRSGTSSGGPCSSPGSSRPRSACSPGCGCSTRCSAS